MAIGSYVLAATTAASCSRGDEVTTNNTATLKHQLLPEANEVTKKLLKQLAKADETAKAVSEQESVVHCSETAFLII